MESIRKDELQELLDVVRMKPYGKILITGAAGSGKTFLLNIIGKILEEQGRKIWYETMVFSQMGNKIWKHSSDFTDVVCLVDGGKDLIVLNNSVLGDLVIYAECKKKAPKHPVNVGLVRQLYGTVEADRVTAGIMVTNSYFSKDARRFQQTIKSRMNLMDYSELMKQIMDCR